ncbi:uncharacterized protein LOC100572355 [Acyrthosiphon pisum]|uniref:Uncharacterized protein n=1 Tax=Acyrthosiphon pisum TaxID=7029 RepID=A0A8R1W6P8_ACYPI|nr:uncharacterized protein LOC100572355 [Acyrthosiphon pisum]|eukprot:XP_003240785.1 PREDICTED: uncharacterized protein LOC100572355 [Acyrthosiphon pisum]
MTYNDSTMVRKSCIAKKCLCTFKENRNYSGLSLSSNRLPGRSWNSYFGYQNGKQEDTLMRSDWDSSNHHTPSPSSVLFVVKTVVSKSATINNEAPTCNLLYTRATPTRPPFFIVNIFISILFFIYIL